MGNLNIEDWGVDRVETPTREVSPRIGAVAPAFPNSRIPEFNEHLLNDVAPGAGRGLG
jgi:hypothetical protein